MGTKSKRRLLRRFLTVEKIPNLEAEIALVQAAKANAAPAIAYKLHMRLKSLRSKLDASRHRLRMMEKAAARRKGFHERNRKDGGKADEVQSTETPRSPGTD